MEQLKLIALDQEDLGVISTYCQDSVGKIADLEYLPGQRRFVLTFNRYVWENNDKRRVPERRRCVLHFNQVNSVKIIAIDRSNPQDVLSLLAVTFDVDEPPGGIVNLMFSGESAIALDVECIEAQLSDMDAAWKAKSRPVHKPD